MWNCYLFLDVSIWNHNMRSILVFTMYHNFLLIFNSSWNDYILIRYREPWSVPSFRQFLVRLLLWHTRKHDEPWWLTIFEITIELNTLIFNMALLYKSTPLGRIFKALDFYDGIVNANKYDVTFVLSKNGLEISYNDQVLIKFKVNYLLIN